MDISQYFALAAAVSAGALGGMLGSSIIERVGAARFEERWGYKPSPSDRDDRGSSSKTTSRVKGLRRPRGPAL